LGAAFNPTSTIPTFVTEGVVKLTVPFAGVVVSHVPPAGLVAVVAVQLKAFAQAPLAVIFTACAAGSCCPIIPWKLSAGESNAIAHEGCTTKLTGMYRGLPAAG